MQRHAMALGYFFLALFCVYVSPQSYPSFRSGLLLAGLAAALAGFAFLFSACAGHLPAAKARLVEMIRLAQQPPTRESQFDEEHSV